MSKKTVALFILDGFGYSETSQSNAIEAANCPTWDHLWENYPHSLIQTSGLAVGLPDGQMGNSEVGHMNLGAGRIVYQNFTKIDKAIADGDFFENAALTNAIDHAVTKDKAIHILGLLSPGGVHSHEHQITALMELAVKRGASKVYLHAFLDGRDTPPRSAKASLEKMDAIFSRLGTGHIASMIGRYYAMDRDNRWERVQAGYDLLTQGKADIVASNALAALADVYAQDKDDEFCPATSIRPNGKAVTINDGDAVIFMNFRPDRAREMTRALAQDNLDSTLDRSIYPKIDNFVMLTEYASDLNNNKKIACAFPPETLSNTLGEYLAKNKKTQLRIAETEKYAHVTFFFSGGVEDEYIGEKRILIPSPDVATYDLQPEMSAPEVTDNLVAAIESGEYDAIICNYANGDMVGHTGKMDAAVKAVEALDACLKRVTDAILKIDGECLITADHGNVELMVDPVSGDPVTSHTNGPVPLVHVSNKGKKPSLREGKLSDVAPTLLHMMGMETPQEMTGENLLSE